MRRSRRIDAWQWEQLVRRIKGTHMNPFRKLEDVQQCVEAFDGRPEDFELPISDELLDPVGMNMAIITDSILAKGWTPHGYEQKEGYRIYRYKDLD